MFHVPSTMAIQQLEVLHLSGNRAISIEPGSTEFDLDLSNLPAGLYIVKATSGNRWSIYKIIKL